VTRDWLQVTPTFTIVAVGKGLRFKVEGAGCKLIRPIVIVYLHRQGIGRVDRLHELARIAICAYLALYSVLSHNSPNSKKHHVFKLLKNR